MKVEWHDHTLSYIAGPLMERAAARIAKEANVLAAGRFSVTSGRLPGVGIAAWSYDEAARVGEYGTEVTAPEPWANEAIKEAGYRSDR